LRRRHLRAGQTGAVNQSSERHTTTPEILLGAYIAIAGGDTQPSYTRQRSALGGFRSATIQMNFPTQCIDRQECPGVNQAHKLIPLDREIRHSCQNAHTR
jgi:hypothetical protein